MARYLIDANVALRLMETNAPEHPACRQALRKIVASGDEPVLAPQVIYEFWVVTTRPREQNGFGWTPDQADEAIDQLTATLTLMNETPNVYNEWRRIVVTNRIQGKRAHDARLVAFQRAHGIDHILTFDIRGFANLTDGVVHPANI